MITGNPEAVETAARSLSTAGTGLAETGETVGHHARTLDASWSGSASGAATRSITGLAQRIGSGGPPCASVHDALITYAQALRDAQREWAAAHATAAAGESALNDAKADQIRARALPTAQDDPHTGPVVSSPAIRAADSARTTAADSVAAAKTAMADAVARLAQANQAAATAVDAATGALADMGGTGAPEGGRAEAIKEGHARRADEARVDDQQPDGFGDAVTNVIGGAGDGAWTIGPGLLGWAGGLIPGRAGDAVENTVEGWHDDLERSFGADTDSLAYRGTSGGVQVPSLFIPGMGVVKASRVIGAARDIKALGVVGSAAKAAGAVRAAPAAVVAGARTAAAGSARMARVVGSGAASTARAVAERVASPFTAKVRAADEVGTVALRGNTGGRSAEEWRTIFQRFRDPEDLRAYELHLQRTREVYTDIRAGSVSLDPEAVARAAGISPGEGRQVIDHVFFDEHLMNNADNSGVVTKVFDFNEDMALAFERIEQGNPFQSDVDLVRHELAESRLMRADPDLTYEDAHNSVLRDGYTWRLIHKGAALVR